MKLIKTALLRATKLLKKESNFVLIISISEGADRVKGDREKGERVGREEKGGEKGKERREEERREGKGRKEKRRGRKEEGEGERIEGREKGERYPLSVPSYLKEKKIKIKMR